MQDTVSSRLKKISAEEFSAVERKASASKTGEGVLDFVLQFMMGQQTTKYTLTGSGKKETPSGGDNLCLGWTTDDRLYLIKVLYIQGGRVWAQVWV